MFNRKKDLPEKAATVKRFEYLPLGSELNKELSQKNSTKDQTKLIKFTKMNIKQLQKEKPVLKKYNKSNLLSKNTAFMNIVILHSLQP